MDIHADTVPSPDVEFCGYSIPHPSEAKMNIRIQSYGTCFPRLRRLFLFEGKRES